MLEEIRCVAAFRDSLLGYAEVVLLEGSAADARVVDSRRIVLSDPALPQSRQPYHDEAGALRADGPELSRLIESIEQFGRRSVIDVIDSYERAGYRLDTVAILVGTLGDPDTFPNDRMRAHVLEERLFRRVIEGASAQRLVPSCIVYPGHFPFLAHRVRDRGASDDLLRRICGRLHADSTAPALAAWLVLADLRSVTRPC